MRLFELQARKQLHKSIGRYIPDYVNVYLSLRCTR